MERRAGTPGHRLRHRSRRDRPGHQLRHRRRQPVGDPRGQPWYVRYDQYRYDLDEAKRLLDESGVRPTALDMLVTSEYPETVTAAQVVADNLAPLGISVNIRTVDMAGSTNRTPATSTC